MRRLLLLAALLTPLAFPFPASADVPISNPSVATDGALYASVGAAQDYWRSQGYRPCDSYPLWVYTEVGPMAGAVAARSYVGLCWGIYFERGYVRMIRARMRRDPAGALAALCYISAHEVAHTLGFNHGRRMNNAMWPALRYCRQWGLTAARAASRLHAMKTKNIPQPKVRSRIAREAWDQTGGGTHGGSRKAQRRKDRQAARRELRAIRQEG